MRPGWRRPFSITFELVDVDHPDLAGHDHEPRRRSPQYRDGRRPLRSRTAPITVPSVNAIDAGPSHGSIRAALYW